nr:hypothetical protein [Tanacetum cinerariifolium]
METMDELTSLHSSVPTMVVKEERGGCTFGVYGEAVLRVPISFLLERKIDGIRAIVPVFKSNSIYSFTNQYSVLLTNMVSEPGSDPGTCGLWAHHASAAPQLNDIKHA